MTAVSVVLVVLGAVAFFMAGWAAGEKAWDAALLAFLVGAGWWFIVLVSVVS